MIRFDQRNFDVQGTERVFKKVVHPGQNIRLVDKDGIPLQLPNTTALSRLHSTYVLSPRGVPTRKSNHSYSGQLAQAKMQSLVNSLETTPPQEMVSYTSMHNVGNGLSSAGSSRHYIPTNLTPKKRTFGSGPPRSVKSMPTKSASTQRSRYLTSAPATEQMSQITDPDSEKSNDSPQGKRLEKEWSALSQCRALKRSSEIVSHRVDRMYFMTGNKLKLQSKYLIEDDELKHLQELSQARASSRASRDEMQKHARSLMKKREYEDNGRLNDIERKLSNIEHRLSFIEERTEDRTDPRVGPRSVHINDKVDIETLSRSSSESGIQEDEAIQDIGVGIDNDEDEEYNESFKDDVSMKSIVSGHEDNHVQTIERPVSRVEIRSRLPRYKQSAGIKIWDILSHDKSTSGAETMLKLFEAYPKLHARTRYSWEKNECDTVNELTLGISRKVRRAKIKSSLKKLRPAAIHKDELREANLQSPNCCMCKCDKHKAKSKEKSIYMPRDTREDHLKQSFPARKPKIKISHQYPVECDCRLDPQNGNVGKTFLAVMGKQVPLRDRDVV